MNYQIYLLALVIICGHVFPVFAEPVYDGKVKADLISDTHSAMPGSSFWLGLKMNMDDGWHTYWRNSGDSGMPTSIRWELPEGFEAGEINWPIPQRFVYDSGLVGYGYEGEVILLTELRSPSQIESGSIAAIKAKVRWLSCKEICVPGKAEFFFPAVVFKSEPMVHEEIHDEFQRLKARLPLLKSDWEINAIGREDEFVLRFVSHHDKENIIRSAAFFPYQDDIIDHAAKQDLADNDSGMTELTLKRSKLSGEQVQVIPGLMILEQITPFGEETQAVAVEIPVLEYQ